MYLAFPCVMATSMEPVPTAAGGAAATEAADCSDSALGSGLLVAGAREGAAGAA